MKPSPLFNITNIIHMITSVSRRLNILCIMLKIIALVIYNAARPIIYVKVGILLACGKH